MRISDWSSDVCSSDLGAGVVSALVMEVSGVSGSGKARQRASPGQGRSGMRSKEDAGRSRSTVPAGTARVCSLTGQGHVTESAGAMPLPPLRFDNAFLRELPGDPDAGPGRSEEPTSELQ